MRDIIFVLGSPNAADGELSPISVSRIECAIALQSDWPNSVVMATGGFGKHFNTTKLPHREHVHRKLSAYGARFSAAGAADLLSSNTVEDATMITAFTESRSCVSYAVVTSGFHLPRCRYIFACLATNGVEFFAAVDPPDLNPEIERHEAVALAQLIAQGGVLIDGVLHPYKPRRL